MGRISVWAASWKPEIHEDMPYVFVDGAMEMELLPQDGEKVVFTEEAWKKGISTGRDHVPKKNGSGLVFMRRRRHYLKSAELLAAAQPVFYRKKPADVFKQRSGWGRSGLHHIHRWLYQLRGYSIYYERNQLMQDYMIARKDILREESRTDDRAIRDFRKKWTSTERRLYSRKVR